MAPEQLRTRRLAIDGGLPVRGPYAGRSAWPQPADGADEELLSVLNSGGWAISSPHRGELSERRFAARFAPFTEARHCGPTGHGSSALMIALESLGPRRRDLVLAPALTWTASATAVLRAGLVPVLVDVGPWTGCMTPDPLGLDVGARVVIAVHWACCSIADVPALLDGAAYRGMSVIEDVAQAHGARWQGRSAGALGRLGVLQRAAPQGPDLRGGRCRGHRRRPGTRTAGIARRLPPIRAATAAPGTGCATSTANWCSWDGWTTRSSRRATASSPARSRPCSGDIR
ncbi:DegT/DnrJ/EryC1/StrS family aminotransferase [Streptomyces sp. NPDC001658]